MTSLTTVLVVALLAVMPRFEASRAAADASGTWEITVTTDRGSETGTMVLTRDSDKYSGTITSTRGDSVPIDATVKDKVITIKLTAQTANGPVAITFSGAIEGDAMSGTGEFGGRGTGSWSAKRTPAAATTDVSGAWTLEVTTDQGSGTPTFTFKQEGEKLTGQYRGQFGEAPVTGTIKGSDIVFATDVAVEGTTARITYTGTVQKDTMKGTVRFAELAQGTFTGTRKR